MEKDKNHNISYWERKEFYRQWDLIVVGGGIVGLSTAISFIELRPGAKVLVLERGVIPNGASTKNAGFACFGTAGEILDDLSSMPAETVWQTIRLRWQGLRILRERLGDEVLQYEQNGGFELFYDQREFNTIVEQLPALNAQIQKHLGLSDCFTLLPQSHFNFPGVCGIIKNSHEGQLDAGAMMRQLGKLASGMNITQLNGIFVEDVCEDQSQVLIHSTAGTFTAAKAVIAINGFAGQLLSTDEVTPARAQVLVTSPIKDLSIKGTFHFDRGYYYFRNIDDRILFGGGRNLDFNGETSTEHHLNTRIQEHLEELLRERILPEHSYSIEQRWTGIMGLGTHKLPVIRFTGKKIVSAFRLGGMGIAIGSIVGKNAAELVNKV